MGIQENFVLDTIIIITITTTTTTTITIIIIIYIFLNNQTLLRNKIQILHVYGKNSEIM